jgi:hypothetical protein
MAIPRMPDSTPTHFETTSFGRRTWTIPATINAKTNRGRILNVRLKADFIPVMCSPSPRKYPNRRSAMARHPKIIVGTTIDEFLPFPFTLRPSE